MFSDWRKSFKCRVRSVSYILNCFSNFFVSREDDKIKTILNVRQSSGEEGNCYSNKSRNIEVLFCVFVWWHSHFAGIAVNCKLSEEPGKRLLIPQVSLMWTVTDSPKINEKTVSGYVVEVAYTVFYIDSDLRVQEAGKITFFSPCVRSLFYLGFFERRGEASLFWVRGLKYGKKLRLYLQGDVLIETCNILITLSKISIF